MALIDIDKALALGTVKLGDRVVVKTHRDGFSGIFNQHTFTIKTEDGKTTLVEDGLAGALPVVEILEDKVHAVFNTKIDRYNPAEVVVLKPIEGQSIEKVALEAFKEFAFDEFTFPSYNICVQTILVDVVGDEGTTPPADGGTGA